MISLNALSSRRSPIGEVLRQVVRGCLSRCTMYHHCSSPFSACDSQSVGSDKPNEVCPSMKDATSIVGCNSGLHVGKRSEGKVSLPLCSLTIWYYRYALTLHIAKPDPAYAWHSELNTSLGTTTRNHDSEPTKSIRCQHCMYAKSKLVCAVQEMNKKKAIEDILEDEEIGRMLES